MRKERPTDNRESGGSSHYYQLPEGATELRDLIYHKGMSHPHGEAFCALYRLKDTGEYKRSLEKVIYYCEWLLECYEKETREEYEG